MSDAAEIFIALVDEVMRTRGRVLAATAQFGSDDGLTGSQMTVLASVTNALRPPTVPQIARSLGHTRQSVQRLADTLVDVGLLETADNPDHRRARLLIATPAGHRIQANASARSRAWALRVTDGLDPGELAATTAMLRTVRAQMEHVHGAEILKEAETSNARFRGRS